MDKSKLCSSTKYAFFISGAYKVSSIKCPSLSSVPTKFKIPFAVATSYSTKKVLSSSL